eukprot:1162003-Pelagomonas_calceolata.AAC.10
MPIPTYEQTASLPVRQQVREIVRQTVRQSVHEFVSQIAGRAGCELVGQNSQSVSQAGREAGQLEDLDKNEMSKRSDTIMRHIGTKVFGKHLRPMANRPTEHQHAYLELHPCSCQKGPAAYGCSDLSTRLVN